MSKDTSKTCYMSAPSKKSRCQKELQQKADLYMAKQSYSEAIKSYLNTIMIDKNNVEAYLNIGICYKNLGNIKKAISYLEKAAVLDVDNFSVFYELGLCHLEDKVPCKAIKCFIHAVQIEPDNSDAIFHLGLAHEQCEEPDMAMMVYQKLIENTPNYINSYVRKSTLLIKMDLYKQAIPLLMKALKINPNKSSIYSDLGLCFDKLGQQSSAKRFYRKYLSAQPDSDEASNILQRVKRLKPSANRMSNLALV